MPITITLHRFEGCKISLCTETLEKLEDKLRNFLINECLDDFTIEDSYTGNELSSDGGEEEEIYECEHCNAEFSKSEILYRDFGGEIGEITFCPHCKEATRLICVTGVGTKNE